MRDPIEQLHRIQNAIVKITEYAKKGLKKNRVAKVSMSNLCAKARSQNLMQSY